MMSDVEVEPFQVKILWTQLPVQLNNGFGNLFDNKVFLTLSFAIKLRNWLLLIFNMPLTSDVKS